MAFQTPDADAMNISESVVQQIINDCAANGVSIDENLSAYCIKLMVLDPDNGFLTDEPLGTDELVKLVGLCVEKLCRENCPYGSTMRLQVEFMSNNKPRKEQVAEHRANRRAHIAPLLKEIVETTVNSKEDLEKLYRKFVAIIILKSGMGNPTHVSVVREATAALQSVFPPCELNPFLTLSQREKEDQIKELNHIVTGIRLFNRDCQKGGEQIEDLPKLLKEAANATKKSMENTLQKTMHHIDALTTALEIHLHWETSKRSFGDFFRAIDGTVEVCEEDLYFLKGCLIAARQFEIYVRKLLKEIVVSDKVINGFLDHMQKRLVQIHDTVRFRTAIPTIEVYPQFIDLSQTWVSMQDEMVILSNLNTLVWNMQRHMQVLDNIDTGLVSLMIGQATILTDSERVNAKGGSSIAPKINKLCELITPEASNFNAFLPQYLGFCAWALVEGTGILIPANLNIGLIGWKKLYYACSSHEAGVSFGQHPQKYINAGLNLARKIPELVELLRLDDQITQQKDIHEKIAKETLVIHQDVSVQTELHPIPSKIDTHYAWDLWEHKRRAVQLANIVKCVTHSTQTERSNFRLSLPLQAGPPKDEASQTKRDSATNVPQLGTWIYGLRGRKDDKQFVIHLTRPVDE